jgi:hypothetical protein
MAWLEPVSPVSVSKHSLSIPHATLLSNDINYMVECQGDIKWVRKMFWNRELIDAILMPNDRDC